jgi:hypothetical protein
MIRVRHLTAAALAALLAGTTFAGPENVVLPQGYADTFVRYQIVDRKDRNTVRFMYITRAAWEAAKAGEPLADGTLIVMEDHKAEMIDDKTPKLDAAGRLIPTAPVSGLFAMAKKAGWGAEYPEAWRNGDWEYARFAPDGTRDTKPVQACFECHKPQAAEDYTFTTLKAVAAR